MPVDITYDNLEPVLFTPDYSFLRYILQKKTAAYNEGLKSVSSSYNSLKRPLTDPVNMTKRDQFLKDAEDQLKKVSSADLSLVENVNAANAVFEPLATDRAFLMDSYWTAKNQQELSQMRTWAESDNPEIRKKYNPEIEDWVRRDMESIRNGGGDPNNYKVKGRSAFAYVNPQDILDKAVKDKGFVVKTDHLGQPYIVTTKGGPGGERNYRTFAENVLASDPLYQQQLAILAENSQESVLEQYKSNPLFAGMDSKTIYSNYAKNSFLEHKQTEETYIKNAKSDLAKETADLTALWNKDQAKYTKGAVDLQAGVNSEEAQMYLDFQQRAAERKSLLDQVENSEKSFKNKYGDATNAQQKLDKFVEDFSDNPKSYFYNLRFKNDITRFSNIQSASVERTIKEDRAYVDMTVAKTNALALASKIQDQITDNMREDYKVGLSELKLMMSGKKTVKNADGTTTVVDVQSDIKPLDVSATQVYAFNALNKFRDQLALVSAGALRSATDTFGSFYLLQSMGLSSDKVGQLRSMFTEYFNGDRKTLPNVSPDQKTILNEALGLLSAFAKNVPGNQFGDKIAALKDISIAQLPELIEKAAAGYTPQNENEMQAMRQIGEYRSDVEKITIASNAFNTARKVVYQKMSTKPGFENMFIQRSDGMYDLVGEQDIYNSLKRFPTGWKESTGTAFISNFNPWHKDPDVSFTEQDLRAISSGFINGTIKASSVSQPVDNQTYTSIQYNGKLYYLATPGYVFPISSDTYQKNIKTINSDVDVTAPEFGQQAGLAYGSPMFQFNGDTKKTTLALLGNVTPTNSNIWQYSDRTATPSQVDAAEQDAVRNALSTESNKKIEAIDVSVNLFSSSPLNSGGQAVKITFPTAPPTATKQNVYDGKSYYFPISPTPKSPEFFHIFDKINEVSEFEPFKKNGKTFSINTFESAGVKVDIRPDQPGSNTGTLVIYQKAYDPLSKMYSDQFSQVGEETRYNLDGITFPELKNIVYSGFIFPYVNQRIQYTKQRQASSQSINLNPQGLFNMLVPK